MLNKNDGMVSAPQVADPVALAPFPYQVYKTLVRVTDETLMRHGLVGVIVDRGEVAHEVSIKFDPMPGEDGPQIETYDIKSFELVGE